MPIGSLAVAPPGDVAERVVRPVTASSALRPLLARSAPARVLAAFPRAVYVAVDDDVVALVAVDALRLPNALVLPVAGRSAPFAQHAVGQPGELVGGSLRLGPVDYRPVREWSPRATLAPGPQPEVHPPVVRALQRHLAAAAPGHRAHVERVLVAAGARLRSALARLDVAAGLAAARELVGLGPGLTPSGDDLLAGALVTCAQLRAVLSGGAVAATAAEVGRGAGADAGLRTSAPSAALLRCAARGLAAEPVLGVVDALVGRRALVPALDALLAVGHSSGHDTARGVLLAAQALLDRGRPGAPQLDPTRLDRPGQVCAARQEHP